MSCLSAFRSCIVHGIRARRETLFWKDNWLNGRAPMYIWQEEFRRANGTIGTVRDLISLLYQPLFSIEVDVISFKERWSSQEGVLGDTKRWRLTGNGCFTVKSFYTFLNDCGLRCPVVKFFWKSTCPKKNQYF